MYTNKKIASALLGASIASRAPKIINGLLLMVIMCASASLWSADWDSLDGWDANSEEYFDLTCGLPVGAASGSFDPCDSRDMRNGLKDPLLSSVNRNRGTKRNQDDENYFCAKRAPAPDGTLCPPAASLCPDQLTELFGGQQEASAQVQEETDCYQQEVGENHDFANCTFDQPDYTGNSPLYDDSYDRQQLRAPLEDFLATLLDSSDMFGGLKEVDDETAVDARVAGEAAVDGYVVTAPRTAAIRDQSWMCEQPLKCYMGGCCYIASDKKDLSAHRRTHSPGEKYTCDFPGCGHTTPQLIHLTTHRRTHTGEKPYECGIDGCTYTTTNLSSVKSHRRTHTGEKPYECGIDGCTYTAAHLGSVKSHRKTHTGEKPYECGIDGCTYTAGDRGNLKTHQATHTGERPYECGIDGCTYTAVQSSDVTKHRRIHSGEKPFVCGIGACTYAAARSDSLKRHKRKHTGEKPFVCGAASKALLPSPQVQSPDLRPILVQQVPESSNPLDSNLSPLVVDPADWDATNYVDTPNGLEAANDDHWPSDLIAFNNYLKANAEFKPDADVGASATDDAEENTRSALLPSLPVLHSDSNAMLPSKNNSNMFGSLTVVADGAAVDGDVVTAPRTAATKNQSWMCEQPLKCYMGGCCYIANNKNDLKMHINAHPLGQLYKCDYKTCDYKTPYRSSLKTHQKTHAGEKPFVCGVASKALLPSPQVQSPDLRPILVQQVPESSNALDSNLSPLVVDPADWDATNCVDTSNGLEVANDDHWPSDLIAFNNYPGANTEFIPNAYVDARAADGAAVDGDVVTALQTAVIRDQGWMGKQPLKCYRGECCYIASDNKDLNAHRRTHSPDEKYTCDFPGCGQTAAQIEHLKKHQRIHTGENPFKCDFNGCTYAATRAIILARHQKTHAGEKPFVCGVAGKTLLPSPQVQSPKKFICKQCAYATSQVNDYEKHLENCQLK